LEGSAIAVGRRGGSPIYYKFVDLLVQQVVLQRDGEDPDLKAFAVGLQAYRQRGVQVSFSWRSQDDVIICYLTFALYSNRSM